MRERGGALRLLSLAVVLSAMALAVPATAAAATVVNGNFETGNFEGWQVETTNAEIGDWFNYEGTAPPFNLKGNGRETAPLPAPPQGKHAAVADQLNPSTMILYQDVYLAPEMRHQLSFRTYYTSYRPLAVPSPDTLSPLEEAGGQANQQFRIDVMRPEAPLDSIAPEDVLRTAFQVGEGDPASMPPARITANLTPFAGQTVRLRFAVVATKEALNAGIDEVAITTTPPDSPSAGTGMGGGKKGGPGAGGAAASLRVLGRAKSLGNGGAIVRVRVPAAGRLTAKRPKLLVPASAESARARVVSLRLKPTAKAMGILRRKGKLRLKVALAFDPRGAGTIQRASTSVLLKLAASN
jgi:hypothetical protein